MCKAYSEEIVPDGKAFLEEYHLKTELVEFCRLHGLQTTGNKNDLNERIVYYLETGRKITKQTRSKRHSGTASITDDLTIGTDFVCSQLSRRYFEKRIGTNFKFSVPFQKWLRNNSERTYNDAVIAYGKIIKDEKAGETKIVNNSNTINTYVISSKTTMENHYQMQSLVGNTRSRKGAITNMKRPTSWH